MTTQTNLITFQSSQIKEIWNEVTPYIEKVLNKTNLWYSIEDIYASLSKAKMQLWTSFEGTQLKSICITQILIHPKHKSLEIILHAGDNKHGHQFLKPIEEWAKSQGCDKVFLKGRKGWIKRMPDYRLESVTLEKEL